MIDAVVAPVLQDNDEPGAADAVNTELPQLLTTETEGAAGIGLGAAVPLPAVLVHPFSVRVTV